MKKEKIIIGKRAELNITSTDKFKSDYFSVNLLLPLSYENSYKYSLILALLMSGSSRYPSKRALCRRLEELYGADIIKRNQVRGAVQIIGLSLDMLSDLYTAPDADNLNRSLDLLFDIILSPKLVNGAFDPELVRLEKNLQIEKLRAQINNKPSYVQKRCMAKLCEGEPYGIEILGEADEVLAITPEELYAAYKQMLADACLQIFYIGSADTGALTERVIEFEKTLSSLYPPSGLSISAASHNALISPSEPLVYKESLDASQGHLALGYRLFGDEIQDRAVRTLLFAYLSYSPVSRLFMNVREKLSLCYYIKLSYDADARAMIITSGVKNENFALAISAINREIQDIISGRIELGAFESARAYSVGSLKYIEDSPPSIERYELSGTMENQALTIDEYREKLLAVTPEQMSRAAACISPFISMLFEGNGAPSEDDDE